MNFLVVRRQYSKTTTIGIMYQGISSAAFCYTLEDVVRPKGSIKVPGQTAIPSGRYEMILNFSDRFQRVMPLLLNVPGFVGVRLHGGNTAADTEGCLIVAHNYVNESTIQGTAEKEITELLNSKNTEKHFIEIVDTFPYVGIK